MRNANGNLLGESSPVKRTPFALAFSPRRMSQNGFDRRTPPARSRAKTLAEIVNAARAKLRHGHRWGDRQLDAARLTLDYKPEGHWQYKLHLERVWDSASLLDWIFQIHGKAWADTRVMKDLLEALCDIFDPQASLCSCGMNKELPEDFLATRIKPPTKAEREESYRQARQIYEV